MIDWLNLPQLLTGLFCLFRCKDKTKFFKDYSQLTRWTVKKQNNAAESDDSSFFTPYVLLSCQNLPSTSLSSQRDCQQFSWRFGCVILVMTNVGLSCQPQAEIRSEHQMPGKACVLTSHPRFVFILNLVVFRSNQCYRWSSSSRNSDFLDKRLREQCL